LLRRARRSGDAHGQAQLELRPEVAKRFATDMGAFNAETSPLRRDEIAAGTLYMPKQHYGGELRLADIRDLFGKLRDVLG
jgi:hypothetical protein